MTKEEYMQRTLDLAAKGKGKTSPNPLVGSIIVKGSRIIAEGYHIKAGTPHAEAVALNKAGKPRKVQLCMSISNPAATQTKGPHPALD